MVHRVLNTPLDYSNSLMSPLAKLLRITLEKIRFKPQSIFIPRKTFLSSKSTTKLPEKCAKYAERFNIKGAIFNTVICNYSYLVRGLEFGRCERTYTTVGRAFVKANWDFHICIMHFEPVFSFLPPESIKKPLIFYVFRRYRNRALAWIWLTLNKCTIVLQGSSLFKVNAEIKIQET